MAASQKKNRQFILALDQGTTSSRAILFNRQGKICGKAQKEFRQHYPKPGWVEHDPEEIWTSQHAVAVEAVTEAGLAPQQIGAIGITNQRETVVVWNRKTGQPIYPAIVWQDRRTAAYCDQLKSKTRSIRARTGLLPDPYFSATKICWILDHVRGARRLAESGQLACGTIDSWLIWKLTGGRVHATDASNASRTMLYNLSKGTWDPLLLDLLNIPKSMLPEIKPSSGIFGEAGTGSFWKGVPIAGVAGDQQAALFGQACLHPGMVKNTYGTGCFVIMQTGEQAVRSKNQLLTTVAWHIDGKTEYALEGSIFIAGAVVQWLRDGMGIIESSEQIEKLARQVDSCDGVYFVPAFAGLGAPHWDAYARGTLIGLTRGSTKAHIARAALEAIAYQSLDVVKAMEADAGFPIKEMRVDGGAAVNDLLMQFQADLLRRPVIRPAVTETTAQGAAFLAGLAIGYWQDRKEIEGLWREDKIFQAQQSAKQVRSQIANWHEALARSRNWA